MRRAVGLGFLVLALSVSTVAFPDYPRPVFAWIPLGSTLGRVGDTSLEFGWDGSRLAAELSRSVAPWLDVTWTAAPEDLFSLGARLRLLEVAGLLSLSLRVTSSGARLLAGLSVGPVRFDWGRTVWRGEDRYVLGTMGVAEGLAVSVGMTWGTTRRPSPLFSVRALGGGGESAALALHDGRLEIAWSVRR